jgi:hypothetical protein
LIVVAAVWLALLVIAPKYYDISKKMANLSLIPTINDHPEDVVVANGTSCRQQIF